MLDRLTAEDPVVLVQSCHSALLWILRNHRSQPIPRFWIDHPYRAPPAAPSRSAEPLAQARLPLAAGLSVGRSTWPEQLNSFRGGKPTVKAEHRQSTGVGGPGQE
jgi:hypothetical protein